MKAAVISDGAWGTALALTLHYNGHDVALWGAFADNIRTICEHRENRQFLPGVCVPEGINVTTDMEEATEGASLLVLATPSQYKRAVLENIASAGVSKEAVYLNVTKGIELESGLRMQEVTRDILGAVPYAALSGPSHAEEVARQVPTAVVAASASEDIRQDVQEWLTNDFFRVYTSDDVTGVELGGALKNVLALGVGVCDGMDIGDNAKAALMTRGIAEMARLGRALGGRAETLAGLSGIGDLVVTCMSQHSRNRYVGNELGRGRTLQDITDEMGKTVAEGVKTAASAKALADKAGVDAPIINAVYATLYEGTSCQKVIRDLMSRKPKPEHFGEEKWMP